MLDEPEADPFQDLDAWLLGEDQVEDPAEWGDCGPPAPWPEGSMVGPPVLDLSWGDFTRWRVCPVFLSVFLLFFVLATGSRDRGVGRARG